MKRAAVLELEDIPPGYKWVIRAIGLATFVAVSLLIPGASAPLVEVLVIALFVGLYFLVRRGNR